MHTQRRLEGQYKNKQELRDSSLRWLKKSVQEFEKYPDPVTATNIVREAAELARYQQSLQDLDNYLEWYEARSGFPESLVGDEEEEE